MLRLRAVRLVERARAEAGLPAMDRAELVGMAWLELCGLLAEAEEAKRRRREAECLWK